MPRKRIGAKNCKDADSAEAATSQHAVSTPSANEYDIGNWFRAIPVE
jgi:hypothetical protein